MSYPQFNLITLQLPAPASNMTKAEYKAAYGIDLDEVNIKAFKLVLLGNEKYPIDQIKVVEDGYEIYFNGRILSITDIVQTSDEVYDVANSKPIYCHPLEIYAADSALFTALLFNNSSEKIDTWDKLKTAISAFGGSIYNRLLISGGMKNGSDIIIASELIEVVSEHAFRVIGVKTDGTVLSVGNGINVTNYSFALQDDINKIN